MYEMNEKIYIFDLDGTLIDSMSAAVEILLNVLRERGISYPENIVDIMAPLGYRGTAKYFVEEMGLPASEEETYARFHRDAQRAYAEEISLKPTVKEALRALKARGVRLCVLTASPHAFIDPCLKREGVFDWFEKVWSSEDFGLTKGNPLIFEEVAKRLGVAVSDLTIFDDSLNVVKTAKAAGVRAIGVYDDYGAKFEKEMREAADGYIYTLSEALEKE